MKQKSSEKIIKEKISKELLKISYNPSHLGTHYLIETIYLIYQNTFLITNLEKNIYTILSQKYNTNSKTIKVDIFEAINQSYYNCDEKTLNNYLHRKLTQKPFTKDIIQAVLENI